MLAAAGTASRRSSGFFGYDEEALAEIVGTVALSSEVNGLPLNVTFSGGELRTGTAPPTTKMELQPLHETVTAIWCQPVAPLGKGACHLPVWTAPASSVARTARR
jgi:hypothetical protein